eukprot:31513-Pelagococcus_subviridis.AAC.1
MAPSTGDPGVSTCDETSHSDASDCTHVPQDGRADALVKRPDALFPRDRSHRLREPGVLRQRRGDVHARLDQVERVRRHRADGARQRPGDESFPRGRGRVRVAMQRAEYGQEQPDPEHVLAALADHRDREAAVQPGPQPFLFANDAQRVDRALAVLAPRQLRVVPYERMSGWSSKASEA